MPLILTLVLILNLCRIYQKYNSNQFSQKGSFIVMKLERMMTLQESWVQEQLESRLQDFLSHIPLASEHVLGFSVSSAKPPSLLSGRT